MNSTTRLLDKLVQKAIERLEKEKIPSKRTLGIIDKIIGLNSLSQYHS